MTAEKLTAKALDRMARKVAKIIEKGAHVVLLGAPDTTHPSGLSMSEIMAIHEYGTDTIPERAPVKKTVDTHRDKYTKRLAAASKKALSAGGKAGYERLGVEAVSDIQRTIKSRVDPGLAESTIAKKGSDVPLIDDGDLWQAYSYEVI